MRRDGNLIDSLSLNTTGNGQSLLPPLPPHPRSFVPVDVLGKRERERDEGWGRKYGGEGLGRVHPRSSPLVRTDIMTHQSYIHVYIYTFMYIPPPETSI